jgi:hypothetical protein
VNILDHSCNFGQSVNGIATWETILSINLINLPLLSSNLIPRNLSKHTKKLQMNIYNSIVQIMHRFSLQPKLDTGYYSNIQPKFDIAIQENTICNKNEHKTTWRNLNKI